MPQERNYEARDHRTEGSRGGARERTSAPRHRSRRPSTGRTAGFVLLYVACVIGASVLLACIGWIAAGDLLALNKEPKTVTITISSDDSFSDVTDRLKEEGLIEYKFLFKLFAAVTGGDDDVTMGTYTLNTDMDYRALLNGMSANSSTKATVSVTITEGMTVSEIFRLLEERGVATAEDLEEMAAEHDYAFSFLQDIPLGDAERLEGYLFPDTYEFYTPHSALYAINRMLVRFDEVFTEEMRAQVAESGRTIQEVLTVASLIERETDGTDQKQIASVIYNRLNNPGGETQGYLQVDATLVYINGGREPTAADRDIDSPYNTYLNKGLPPGPIANPGLEAIQAAMNPDDTSYYYYVLGDDDTHHFFRTYSEMQNFMATQERYGNS